MNMSRFSKVFVMLAAVAVAASCAKTASIEGTIPTSEVIVKVLDMNRYNVLDTVAVDADGRFSYKMEIEKGQPQFVYLFEDSLKVASLLLQAGDKVTVTADAEGKTCEVTGSDESLKLAQIEKEYSNALNDLVASTTSQELTQKYIAYYRSRVKYVMENPFSLTVVPVFFQNFGPELPVFSQNTDAILFTNAADSLEKVYPESKYVKALRNEAERRFGYLELESRIADAKVVGYPDINLPDTKGEKISLSSVEEASKVTMLYFWSASDAAQKMFNQDILKSLYAEFHDKGFEIYQVALDPDKALWAKVVKEQELPWINVCDGLGANSQYAFHYNVQQVPAVYLLKDGELVDGQNVDEQSIRRIISGLLK